MLFIEEHGAGVPVVLLHGTPTTPDHLRPLAMRLAKRARALLVHLPGYGQSDQLEPYDLRRSHELVEEALLARGVREAHFVGHSGGTYRAFALATRGGVHALSVLALGAVAHTPPATRVRFFSLAEILRGGADLSSMFRDAMLAPKSRADAACVAEVASWASASAPSHLANELIAFADAPDLRPGIAALDVAVLLRVGALDAATPPAQTYEVAAVAKRPTVQIVGDAGHALLIEDFEPTVRAIEEHLRDAG